MAIIAFAITAFLFYPSTKDVPREPLEVVSSATASKTEILDELYEKGYIKSKLSYPVLLILSTFYKGIKRGVYALTPDMNLWQIYLQLANPQARWVRVEEGLRKEEVANVLAKQLGWKDTDKEKFVNAHLALKRDNLEGYYFPENYLIPLDADPLSISKKMIQNFDEKIARSRKSATKTIINGETALTIASIIQREAAGKSDMNLISGIIWNRLFAGMNLQIDATLQYAKGNEKNGWWPSVSPRDKKIDSPYNTYQHDGLPPSPISNPGLAAIEAAYNPQKTACLFYFHDANRKIHCSKTYAEHKALVEKYY